MTDVPSCCGEDEVTLKTSKIELTAKSKGLTSAKTGIIVR